MAWYEPARQGALSQAPPRAARLSDLSSQSRGLGRSTLVAAGMAALVVVVVTVASMVLPLPHALRFPLPAVIAVLLLIASAPLLIRHLAIALVAFLFWLMVEDLIRKLSGNDIRVYFVKDLFYAVVLVALFLSPGVRGAWRGASAWARIPLYALVACAVIRSVPIGLHDIRLPLLGLRLDFLYIPLVVAGYLIARDSRRLQLTLLAAAVLGGAASAVGILQAIIGPSFLAPWVATPGLIHLVLTGGATNGTTLYRPTGTFVDPGRFDEMAITALAVSIAATFVVRGLLRPIALASALLSAVAIWVSTGRTGLLEGVALIIAAGLVLLVAMGRTGLLAAVGVGALAVLATAVISHLEPNLLRNRADYYIATLSPLSPTNELAFRWHYNADSLRRAISIGGTFGLGTGHESLGKQYILGGSQNSPAGLYTVEGGFASVTVEWGLVGLSLWLFWSLAWSWRLLTRLRGVIDRRHAAAAFILVVWIVIFLFPGFYPGFQEFENYTANAYFWLLSGLVLGMPRRARAAEPDGVTNSTTLLTGPPPTSTRVAGGGQAEARAGQPEASATQPGC